MYAEKLERLLLYYIAIVMPALLLLVSMIVGANVLWFILFLSWFGVGLLMVLIPAIPETQEQ